MTAVPDARDPRDIPILTEAIGDDGRLYAMVDAKAVHAAVVTESLKLADSLLHQAAKDIEAILFERVLDQLRAGLPELVDRVLREHSAVTTDSEETRLRARYPGEHGPGEHG